MLRVKLFWSFSGLLQAHLVGCLQSASVQAILGAAGGRVWSVQFTRFFGGNDMLTGIGLLAVAGAILIATAVFHMEVKRVYYPQVKWARDQHEGELFAGDAEQVSE